MPTFDLPQSESYRSIVWDNECLLMRLLTLRFDELGDLDVSCALEEAMREGYFGFEIVRSPLLRWALRYEGGHLVGTRTCVDIFILRLRHKWRERGIREFNIARTDNRIYIVLACREKYVQEALGSIKPTKNLSVQNARDICTSDMILSCLVPE